LEEFTKWDNPVCRERWDRSHNPFEAKRYAEVLIHWTPSILHVSRKNTDINAGPWCDFEPEPCRV